MSAAVVRVPGEDLGWAFPIALGVVGAACCWGALVTWAPRTDDAGRASSLTPAAAPAASPPASVVVERVVERADEARAPAAASPAGAGADPPCPPLVVTFRHGWPGPPPATEAAARGLADFAAANPSATFVVDGHADGTGNEITNFDLSRRRAASVGGLLERAGVARARLTIRGLGAYVPLEGEPETAAANRRVVVQIKNVRPCPYVRQENVNP